MGTKMISRQGRKGLEADIIALEKKPTTDFVRGNLHKRGIPTNPGDRISEGGAYVFHKKS